MKNVTVFRDGVWCYEYIHWNDEFTHKLNKDSLEKNSFHSETVCILLS